jgi:hypothetical protein
VKLVTTLNETFLRRGALGGDLPDDAARERWGQGYLNALRRFQNAGIVVTSDEQAGLAAYVESRSRWDPVVMALAPAMEHEFSQVDRAGAHAARLEATALDQTADSRAPAALLPHAYAEGARRLDSETSVRVGCLRAV